jgi:hypothetical protein
LLPSICANLLYRHNLINNHDSKQNGNLISPVVSADPLKLTTVELDLKTGKQNKMQWIIVYVKPKECNENCEQRIHELKNLKIALGRDYHKVTLNTTGPQQLNNLNLLAEQIYLIDPNNFIMMQYQQKHNTSNILKDIKHLLRYSNG